MLGLEKHRQALTIIQKHAIRDAALLSHAGQALAGVREQERTVAAIRDQIVAIQTRR